MGLSKQTCIRLIFLTIFSIGVQTSTYAHPGNTASDGCHYCRTNCDKWGVPWNERHCHGGYSAPVSTYTQPSCPANSIYSNVEKSCVCDLGYTTSLDTKYCIKIPINAHAIVSTTDVWQCDTGYVEVKGDCVLEQKEEVADSNQKDISQTLQNLPETITDISIPAASTTPAVSNDSGSTLLSLLILGIGGGAVWKYFKNG